MIPLVIKYLKEGNSRYNQASKNTDSLGKHKNNGISDFEV